MNVHLTTVSRMPASRRPRASFRSALLAEWVKARSVRSTMWALLAFMVLTIGFAVLITSGSDTDCPASECGDDDVVAYTLFGMIIGQVGAIVLGVLVISSEYDTGMIHSTFVANPRRLQVFAAKAAIVAALVFAAAAIAVLVSYYAGTWFAAGNGYGPDNGYVDPSLRDPEIARAVGGTIAYAVLVALVGLGIGTILRSTASALSGALGLVFVPLVSSWFLPGNLAYLIERWSPVTAGLSVQQTREYPPGSFETFANPWAGLGVFAAYTAGTLLLAAWMLRRRDA